MIKELFEFLKELFTTHPTVDEFHITADNQAFFEIHHAEANAQTLQNKEIASVTRDQYEQAASEAPQAPATILENVATQTPVQPIVQVVENNEAKKNEEVNANPAE